mmetsp:Transcript_34815/g.109684  ORF Transcript_34815/g.109684 Transcript_34815/m.109684 type:complete len:285 (+) Transcript_34815:1098-1952(+)
MARRRQHGAVGPDRRRGCGGVSPVGPRALRLGQGGARAARAGHHARHADGRRGARGARRLRRRRHPRAAPRRRGAEREAARDPRVGKGGPGGDGRRRSQRRARAGGGGRRHRDGRAGHRHGCRGGGRGADDERSTEAGGRGGRGSPLHPRHDGLRRGRSGPQAGPLRLHGRRRGGPLLDRRRRRLGRARDRVGAARRHVAAPHQTALCRIAVRRKRHRQHRAHAGQGGRRPWAGQSRTAKSSRCGGAGLTIRKRMGGGARTASAGYSTECCVRNCVFFRCLCHV